MSEFISVILNGITKEILDGCSVDSLILSLSLEGQRFAVELNEQVLSRSLFATTLLKPMDKVEIVTAIGGG